MEIIYPVTKADLDNVLPTNYPSYRYITWAINNKCRFSYKIAISADELGSLILNSDTRPDELASSDYPLLREVVMQMKVSLNFFDRDRRDGGLSGKQVKNYFDKLKQGQSFSNLGGILLRDKDDNMRSDGIYYIADGMHRLVALGYYSDFKPEYFPIEVYLCTNHRLDGD